MFQIHLKARGCSGRGVRYRVLKPKEIDHHEIEAGKAVGKEGTIAEYNVEVKRMGLAAMVCEYTAPGLKEIGGAQWTKATAEQLDTGWDDIFNTKDTSILREIYNVEHGTSRVEVDDILAGKAEVLAD